MAMLILSVWSQYSWLPCGHALRMGLDMNLHRALDKLVDSDEQRTEIEERDLGKWCAGDPSNVALSRIRPNLAQLLPPRTAVSLNTGFEFIAHTS